MDDREWDIFMMEMEAGNEAFIEEFMMAKMRPRDLEAIAQQMIQNDQPQSPPEELNAPR